MDNDGTLNWGAYYRPPLLKSNLGLQLMPNVGEGVTKPFFSCGGGGGSHLHLECAIPEPGSMSMTLARDSWFHSTGDSGRMFHGFIGGHHEHSSGYTAVLPETMRPSIGAGAHALHMLQLIDPLREGKPPLVEDPCAPLVGSGSLMKKSKGKVRPLKASKPKRTKKSVPPIEEPSRLRATGRSTKKSVDMVINGIDLDVSRIPAPLCTCTGHPQQCYRWGAGGWQSACCTTSISMYPLPMSAKRKGARIAGRKMSQGAFKKVLEKLAGEGQDFSYPIDLKPFWAKHGTNKFVTIR